MKKGFCKIMLTVSDIDDMAEMFLSGMSIADVANVFGMKPYSVRDRLVERFNTTRLLIYRKKHGKPALTGVQENEPLKPMVKKTRVVSIIKALVTEPEKTYKEIAQDHLVSRERVGQIAELCGDVGWDVSRKHSKRGRPAMRGKAA